MIVSRVLLDKTGRGEMLVYMFPPSASAWQCSGPVSIILMRIVMIMMIMMMIYLILPLEAILSEFYNLNYTYWQFFPVEANNGFD